MTKIDKLKLIQQIREQLSGDLETLQRAADAAHDAAINEESKSEDKHDTRSIEAGYLAGAQRKRVAELKELITYFKFLEPKSFSDGEVISATALVEVAWEDKTNIYFMVPKGGGITISFESLKIQTLTPQTPLGEGILGLKTGEVLTLDVKGQSRDYEIMVTA